MGSLSATPLNSVRCLFVSISSIVIESTRLGCKIRTGVCSCWWLSYWWKVHCRKTRYHYWVPPRQDRKNLGNWISLPSFRAFALIRGTILQRAWYYLRSYLVTSTGRIWWFRCVVASQLRALGQRFAVSRSHFGWRRQDWKKYKKSRLSRYVKICQGSINFSFKWSPAVPGAVPQYWHSVINPSRIPVQSGFACFPSMLFPHVWGPCCGKIRGSLFPSLIFAAMMFWSSPALWLVFVHACFHLWASWLELFVVLGFDEEIDNFPTSYCVGF